MAELRPKRSIYDAEQILSGWENQVPKIGTNGNWWVWDIATMSWKDTGVGAEGRVTGGVADVRIGGASVVNTSGIANVDAVRYDASQFLTASQKQTAQRNIGLGNGFYIDADGDLCQYE